jgi:hypothetical protein
MQEIGEPFLLRNGVTMSLRVGVPYDPDQVLRSILVGRASADGRKRGGLPVAFQRDSRLT